MAYTLNTNVIHRMGRYEILLLVPDEYGRSGLGHRARARTDVALCELHGAESQEGDGVEADVDGVRVVGEGDQAVNAVCEGGRLRLCDVVEVLPHNLLDGVERQPHYLRLLV